MKTKMHYRYGRNQQTACGQKDAITTTNHKEITCKRCLKTKEHRKTKGNASPSQIRRI